MAELNLLLANVPADTDAGKAIMDAVQDAADARQQKVWMILMSGKQMTAMEFLLKQRWKQTFKEVLGEFVMPDKNLTMDIVRIEFVRVKKTRRGWCAMVD